MRLFLAAGALVLAGAAYAQGVTKHELYQNALLARSVPAEVQSFCRSKGASSGQAYDACRVTRLFLSDLAAKRDQGFPPLTDISYAANDAEVDVLAAALGKYGG